MAIGENGLVTTTGYIPGRLPDPTPQTEVRNFVEDRFETSQDYAEKMKNLAGELINEMREFDVLPGSTLPDRNFEFDLDYPQISGITVPEPPSVDYPTMDLPSFPDIEGLVTPSPQSINIEADIPGEVRDKLKQEFFEGLKAPIGYSLEVEQGIYDRARSRREADLKQKKDDTLAQFAKRGFLAPPGAALELQKQYDIEDHREETNLNRDIAQQQEDLARQMYDLFIQAGLNLESHILQRAQIEAQNAMEEARLEMQFIIDTFGQELRKAEIQGSLISSEIQVYAEQARLESLKLDAYQSQIQGVQSRAELERIKAQILGEKRQALSDQYNLQMQQDQQNLTLAQSRAEHRRAIAEHVSQVVSQLAASAMTAVSTSAQISGQASDYAQYSYQMSLSRSDGIRYSGQMAEDL